jgi:hypothetical protein
MAKLKICSRKVARSFTSGARHSGAANCDLKAIAHCDGPLRLNLTEANKKDLVGYLKGI